MIQRNGSSARCIGAVLCLACLFPILEVSAQQKDGATSVPPRKYPKTKLCDTKQPAKVVVIGTLERSIDPCEYVPAATAAGTARVGYGLFKMTNDVRNGKLTESDLTQKIMRYTGASEKTASSIARPWIKKIGTREFKSLTVIAAAGGGIVAVYEFYKASTSEAKVQDTPVKNLLPPSKDTPESTPK
jgi:hypothetical protein